VSGQPAVPNGGIVLCSETLTREPCPFCGQVTRHEPLCVVNLRQLRSMAENIASDVRQLSRRQNRLAESLREVHEAVLARSRDSG
jgi:mRNA-degrading endonuclease toxin of MazEF toxin-antitoxin module